MGESLLAIDPLTRHLYHLDRKTQVLTRINKTSQKAKEHYYKEVEKFETLRGFSISNWSFDSPEAQNYRRRELRDHLLQKDPYPYPAFVTSRELSSAFANSTFVKLYVDISEYIGDDDDVFIEDSDYDMLADSRSKLIKIKPSLVTCADDVVKDFARLIYKKYTVKLKPKSPLRKFTFQVKGRKEYFTGNYPMLAYKCVRTALRGLDYLSVVLTEVPKKWETNFPPYYDLEELPEVVKPALLWYPPAPIPDLDGSSVSPKLSRPRVYQTNQLNAASMREDSVSSLKRGLKASTRMFSGEVEWPFRVKLCGVEGLYNLFAEAFWGEATNNGLDTPRNVTKPKEKKEPKTKRPKSSFKSTRRNSVPVLTRKSKSSVRGSVTSSQVSGNLATSHLSHSRSCTIPGEVYSQFNLPFSPYMLSFEVMLLYGSSPLENCVKHVKYYPFQYFSRFYEWVEFPLMVCEVPRETRLGINIYAVSQVGETQVIGCSCMNVFDDRGIIRTGLNPMNIWPFYKVDERLACMGQYWGNTSQHARGSRLVVSEANDLKYSRVYVQYDSYISKQVSFSLRECKQVCRARVLRESRTRNTSMKSSAELSSLSPKDRGAIQFIARKPQISELAALEKILLKDPLQDLTAQEKQVLFICRDHYKTLPLSLPLFLKSVNWTCPFQVAEAYRMLGLWKPMQPEDSLSLLNADFSDENVRMYAAKRISQLPDDDLALYMPQLVQALCFEVQHLSFLGELLIERSLKNPYVVGHELFWALRSQLHLKCTTERLGLVLEQFLLLCGSFRKELIREVHMINLFAEIGKAVKLKEYEEDRSGALKELIESYSEKFTDRFRIPIDSGLEAKQIEKEKCKVMDSKKLPLWLSLKNKEGAGLIPIIFKLGDDLRQDIISLQMIIVMDNVWLENGLDLRMKPYRVIATGDQSGIVEIVKDSETISKIQKHFGGFLGSFKYNLKMFLEQNSQDEQKHEKIMENFIRSCAGYCVATYILGIGDRHNSNIMLTKTGHLFHIDFGHFLGNFKKKYGINRERTKFVFTDEMADAMGGKNSDGFVKFKNYCCKAYNLVRKHGNRLINLFMLMVSAGMPELQDKEQIKYIREMLSLKLTEMEADNKFTKEIDNTLNNAVFRKFDSWIHNMKH